MQACENYCDKIFFSMMSKPQDHDTAGAIRGAGDGFSKMEVAHEEEYFYKLVSKIFNEKLQKFQINLEDFLDNFLYFVIRLMH